MMKLGCWKTAILAVMLATSLVAIGCGKTVGERIDDTTITTRVKTSMLNDPAVGSMKLDVATVKGVVTISGRVKSQSEHDQALAVAHNVDGVTEVKDAIQIIPASQ
jgi:hyperosmotically inducible periplasmic protein